MITQPRLKEVLLYDRESGLFLWKSTRKVAGSLNQFGYRQIKVDGKSYVAHRLAWLYEFGSFPNSELDHINRERDDNRIANLRPASRAENCRYASRPKSNTSGVIGVSLHKSGKWRADIRVDGRQVTLGYFENLCDAASVRLAAEDKYYGEFAPQSSRSV